MRRYKTRTPEESKWAISLDCTSKSHPANYYLKASSVDLSQHVTTLQKTKVNRAR